MVYADRIVKLVEDNWAHFSFEVEPWLAVNCADATTGYKLFEIMFHYMNECCILCCLMLVATKKRKKTAKNTTIKSHVPR